MNKLINNFLNLYFSSDFNYLDTLRPNLRNTINNFVHESLYIYNSNLNSASEGVLANSFLVKNFQVNSSNIYLMNSIDALRELFLSNKDMFFDVIIFGSFSTNDFELGWSDFDCAIILSNNYLSSNNFNLSSLREVVVSANNLVKNIDPLCHHEFQIILESDLNEIPITVMPPSILETCKSFYGEKLLYVNYYNNNTDVLISLKSMLKTLESACDSGFLDHHPRNDVYLQDNYVNSDDAMYQLKYLLSYIVLVPALCFNAKGFFYSKPDAIRRAKLEFPLINWEIIDKATIIRKNWPAKESYPYHGNAIPEWVKSILGPNYFIKSRDFLKSILVGFKFYD